MFSKHPAGELFSPDQWKTHGISKFTYVHKKIASIGFVFGPQAAIFSELFDAKVRYSGASLSYQLASTLAGGLTPLIATILLARFNGASWPIALYLIGLAMVTLIGASLPSETRPARIAQAETPAEVVKAEE